MDLRVDLASWRNWEDEEILEVLYEHYYTLASTGEHAVMAVLHDIIKHRFFHYHLVDDERMGLILVKFARELEDKGQMSVPAMDFYRSQQTDKG